MTFRQYIAEAKEWEYSQEYFDLLTEAKELELLERYLQNAYYQLYTESEVSDGFFTEAADEDKIRRIEEAVEEKSNSFTDKILKQLKEIPEVIINFLTGLLSHVMKPEKVEVVERMLKTMTPDVAVDVSMECIEELGLKDFAEMIGIVNKDTKTCKLVLVKIVGGEFRLGGNMTEKYQYAKNVKDLAVLVNDARKLFENHKKEDKIAGEIKRINDEITTGKSSLTIYVTESELNEAKSEIGRNIGKSNKLQNLTDNRITYKDAYNTMIANLKISAASTMTMYKDMANFRNKLLIKFGNMALEQGGKLMTRVAQARSEVAAEDGNN